MIKVLQDILLRNNWNAQLAMRDVLDNLKATKTPNKRNQRSVPGKKKG